MSTPLGEIARVFLQLGTTAFGGPVVHVAMMHDQLVVRRRWISDAEFADLLAATNLIPGPNSTEMALHIGRRAGGWPGFFVAGVCFAAPAILLVLALAHAYLRYGHRPDARAVLAGVGPVVIAIVAAAAWSLGRAVLRTTISLVVALAAAIASLAGVSEIWVILGGGLARAMGRAGSAGWLAGLIAAPATLAAQAAGSMTAPSLGLYFLKIGSILFGSGYVLIAFIRADLVDRWGVLTSQQLLDAVAAGQMTPGPLSTTATFIGYLLGGWTGAAAATIGMFAPAFAFVAITHPLVARLRRSRAAAAFLDGAAAASLGVMALAAIRLGSATLTSAPAVIMAAAALLAVLLLRVNAAWLVLAGALVGLAARLR